MKDGLGKSRSVIMVLGMLIFIFVLKLLEFFFYYDLENGYPNIVSRIMDSSCILASAFSLLTFIIIYFYFRNKIVDKRKVLILLILVLIFTISLIYLVVIAFKYSFPTNMRISRIVGLLLSMITCAFIAYKGMIVKH
ncbi:hypothetical protein LGK97_16760 [Clostridium sp. CS001]|uniref:hypothetical protein n=1 Tax=Clostridium sp. CS001 TaxID=2880648 RepID=UPI001CF4EDD6|nr:hypothetical protein [Clostridium sp. CS001]MCB2291380.1 hypothetical protein [Clostridium sp. CS001]